MPYVQVFVDFSDVIDEFDDEEIAEEMRKRGYWCFKKGDQEIEDFAIVQHYFDCGLRDQAKKEAIEIVGQMMGRPL